MRTTAFWLALLLVFMIPWEDVVNLPVLGTAARTMGLLVAAFWGATVLLTGQLRKPSLFQFFALLYVLWCVLSVLWSANLNATLVQILTFVQLLGLACILWDLFTTRVALLAALQMYILGVYVAFGNTVINYFSGATYYYERFSANGTNPDDLGFILALGIPLAWYLAMCGTPTGIGYVVRIINYAYFPAAVMGIALSGTRTAMVATIPGLIYGLATFTQMKLWARIAIFLLLITAGVLAVPYIPEASIERLGTTGTELSSGDLNGRLTIWRQGLVAFTERPWLGGGVSTFRLVNSLGKVAHNTFLSVLVEVGLIGFLLFGLMMGTVVWQAWWQPRWEARLWLTVLITWVIGASTLTWEYRKPTWLFLSLIIVSAAVAHQVDDAVAEEPEPELLSPVYKEKPAFG